MKNLLLSLCIPTEGRVEWVIPVVESIYAQDVDHSLFEVVVSNNGEGAELDEAIVPFLEKYDNLRYVRSEEPLFMNQIFAFEQCRGELIKFCNSRRVFFDGLISYLIDIVRKYRETKPALFFLEGHNGKEETVELSDLNEYISELGIFFTWSGGTSCWRSDLDHTPLRHEEINYYFPHLWFILPFRDKTSYIIENRHLSQELPPDLTKKKGYNVFYVFGVEFPFLLLELLRDGRIDIATFHKLKEDLRLFLVDTYKMYIVNKTPTSMIFENMEEYLNVFFDNHRIQRQAKRLAKKQRLEEGKANVKSVVKRMLGYGQK